MVLPSGDQTGWRASLNRSVMRLAGPPVTGSTQMLPCRSIASILPSGDTDTAMEVPSSTMMVTGLGAGAELPTPAARHSAAASAISLAVTNAPLFREHLAGAAAQGEVPARKSKSQPLGAWVT